jgi:uncharacterized protein YecA (UPF0149 family)
VNKYINILIGLVIVLVGLNIFLLSILFARHLHEQKFSPRHRVTMKFKFDKEQEHRFNNEQNLQMKLVKENLDKIQELHQKLDKEFLKEKANEKEILSIIEQIKNTHKELINIHFAGLLKLRQSLPPEQFKQMVKMRIKNMKREHRGPKGMPPELMMGGEGHLLQHPVAP